MKIINSWNSDVDLCVDVDSDSTARVRSSAEADQEQEQGPRNTRREKTFRTRRLLINLNLKGCSLNNTPL